MEALDIVNREQVAQIDISDIGKQTTVLPIGIYKVYATCSCYIKVTEGSTASDVTEATGDIMLGGNTELYYVPDSGRIGVIADTGVTGTLKMHWVGRRST